MKDYKKLQYKLDKFSSENIKANQFGLHMFIKMALEYLDDESKKSEYTEGSIIDGSINIDNDVNP